MAGVFTSGPAPGMELSCWGDPPTGHTLHHPGLLLLMALSPSADLSGLCLLFEPVWLGSLHGVLHPRGPSGPPGARAPPAPALAAAQVSPCRTCCPLSRACTPLPSSPFSSLCGQAQLCPVGPRKEVGVGRSTESVTGVTLLALPLLGRCVTWGLSFPRSGGGCRSLSSSHRLTRLLGVHRPQQGYPWGGPGPGLPPPPELYPWLPLELICRDTPTTTSDLYSFCTLAQEVFTGELPWAGRGGPEVKAKLEAGESPALDPRVPAPYQALVQAGLGLAPADRWGSLQSTRYLLREATAQDMAPEVGSPMEWTTLSPASQASPPEKLYCEMAHRAKSTPRPVPTLTSPGPIPSQAPETPEVTGHSRVPRGVAWNSGSSLTLGSSPGPGHSPTARAYLQCCGEPGSTTPGAELTGGGLFPSLQKMDLLEEIMAELQKGCQLGEKPSLSPTPDPDSQGTHGSLSEIPPLRASQE
ncbi:inactive serine/threonine-protein kinase TEX14-like [Sapajus apella]|uniref:Inactive serine/threonine-protein kinase TEX14-like n=1 Tax=Sapajus apella TaxID=9515 RepID=A0A6J3FHM0_SAPAP|nr:inactive serine/threonine-protein kinase TEX14-like [Sapajus apella]